MSPAEFENVKRSLAYILKVMQGGSLSVKQARMLAPFMKTVNETWNGLSKQAARKDEEWKSNVNGAKKPSKNQNATSSE